MLFPLDKLKVVAYVREQAGFVQRARGPVARTAGILDEEKQDLWI